MPAPANWPPEAVLAVSVLVQELTEETLEEEERDRVFFGHDLALVPGPSKSRNEEARPEWLEEWLVIEG